MSETSLKISHIMKKSSQSDKDINSKQMGWNEDEEKSIQSQNSRKNKNNETEHLVQNVSSSKQRIRERTRIKTEIWNQDQIKKIFILYSEYGSQWTIIQSEFDDRSANSIKNRFYTVIRVTLKHLFKWHPCILQKLPHEIPSKQILKFYEGREQFSKFKGFGKRILKNIGYNADSKDLKKISEQYSNQILQLFNIMFDTKMLISSENFNRKSGGSKKNWTNLKLKRNKQQSIASNTALHTDLSQKNELQVIQNNENSEKLRSYQLISPDIQTTYTNSPKYQGLVYLMPVPMPVPMSVPLAVPMMTGMPINMPVNNYFNSSYAHPYYIFK